MFQYADFGLYPSIIAQEISESKPNKKPRPRLGRNQGGIVFDDRKSTQAVLRVLPEARFVGKEEARPGSGSGGIQ